jgi:protein-S-isoprenylcysteine O-methyltransferase Ste14
MPISDAGKGPSETTSEGASKTKTKTRTKITPFFVLQFCLAVIAISAVAFRPGLWNPARLAGFCIALSAAVLFFTARWQLGQSFSITPQARSLVTRGIYSKIRNPIYIFSTLMVAGVLIALQHPYALLILVVLVPVQILRARKEAQVLEARFGGDYRRYREGTWF